MRIIKDSKGREIITMGSQPTLKEERRQEEMITTHNIEEVKARRKKEGEAAKAKEEAKPDEKK